MMRRFSRRRRGGAGDVAINGERWFGRMLEEGVLDLTRLEVMPEDVTEEVPGSYAAIGRGEDKDAKSVIVSFAPRSAGDALLAGLTVASKLAEAETDPFNGELLVIAPHWNLAARRRLGLVSPRPYAVRALAVPTLAESPLAVEPEYVREPGVVSVSSVTHHLSTPADRELFARATAALEGLASKHGGAIRGFGRSVELVIMARRVAELRADDSGVVLNTILPARSSARLSAEGLASALDALEGNLRKRLNDRRTREGDEGVRTRLQPLVASAMELRSLVCWPVGGKDLDVIDSVGVNPSGSPVATAARSSLSLAAFGVILDAALELRTTLPVVLANVQAPVRLDLFRLALVAREFAPGVARILPLLNLSHDLVEIRSANRDRGLEVAICGSGEAVPIAKGRGRRGDRGRRPRREGAAAEPAAESAAESASEPAAEVEAAEQAEKPGRETAQGQAAAESGGGRGRPRRRGRRPRGAGREAPPANEEGGEAEQGEPPARTKPRFEEMSSFDLADEQRGDEDEGARSRRRGRRSRGRRRGAADETQGETESPVPAAAVKGRDTDESDEVVDDDALLEETLSELPEAIVSIDEVEVPQYDDEEEGEEGEEESTAREREKRRRQRKAERTVEEKPPEPPKPVRRRVAIVAHADRDSLLSAVLLARELRLLEGIWVYTQAELMSFFRGGATDLREETPIYMIGFTPSPARDVVQAAAIYAGRLTWIDHRSWPPEDLGALKQAIGEDQVWVAPGMETSLPLLLRNFTRRSRFSDKMVDLAAGRFTEHDYERWGRVWWWRLGEIAKRSGPRQRDLDPLLAGRPSDLAKDAAKAETPPPPPEVDFVSKQDFRLVHFAGQSMVILEVPEGLDLNLAARVARERYCASLSLVTREGGELVIVSAEEGSGRRTFDLGGLVDHLADKLEAVTALPDHDHVARFLLRDRAAHADRLDGVISEIVMGRTLLER
ncbi:MAG: hypothetical protein GY944_20975 [bacterium]|nr:hypothetical protein [bacterium]